MRGTDIEGENIILHYFLISVIIGKHLPVTVPEEGHILGGGNNCTDNKTFYLIITTRIMYTLDWGGTDIKGVGYIYCLPLICFPFQVLQFSC